MSDDDALQIFKLFMTDAAADWMESLDDEIKRSFSAISDKFIQRFEASEVFKWQKASEIFSRQQGPQEKVDTFITDILNLARRIPIEDPTIIRFALLKGFKPSIRQHVLQTSADSLEATLKSARVAEAAAAQGPTDSTDITSLTKDVRDLLTAATTMQKAASASPSTERVAYADANADANASSSTFRSSSPRRVSFADEPRRQPPRPASPQQFGRRPVTNSPMNWNWPDEDNTRDNRFRQPPTSNWQHRPSLPSQSWNGSRSPSWTQTPRPRQSTFAPANFHSGKQQQQQQQQQNGFSQPSCRNCGRMHAPEACFARGMQCFNCGRMNHLKVMCRSSPVQRAQPNFGRNQIFSGNAPRPNFQSNRPFYNH